MSLVLELPGSLMPAIGMLTGWIVVLALVFRHYASLDNRPAVWRVLLASLIGVAAVNMNFAVGVTTVKFAFLPIGAWLVYFALKNSSWATYRKFAWIGFWGNYVLLATALLFGWLNQTMYPKVEPSTYIANVEQASLLAIHPTARAAKLDKEALRLEVGAMKEETIDGLGWHKEAVFESSELYRKERFPYAVLGVKPKWGSGLASAIYIESDGLGLLINTAERHFYYRTEMSLLDLEANVR